MFPGKSYTGGVAIDLGTSNTKIALANEIIVDEPSVIAFESRTQRKIAVGNVAKKMLGKTPRSIQVIRPVRCGEIVDLSRSVDLIRTLLGSVQGSGKWFLKTKRPAILAIPSAISGVQLRAARQAAERLNFSDVKFISEPIAAAIGMGLDVESPRGNIVVDIGAGCTQVAVISMGTIVQSTSLKVAGDSFCSEIIAYMRSRYHLLIGENMAETVKIQGAAKGEVIVRGRDLLTGRPTQIDLNTHELSDVIADSVSKIASSILNTLALTPPELSADISKNGIYVSGGGARLNFIQGAIQTRIGLPVHLSPDPLLSVVRGAAQALRSPNQHSLLFS